MPKILRAVKANPGIRAAYRRRLEKLIDEMNASVLWWIRAAYREREDEIVPEPVAADAALSATLSRPADKKRTDDSRGAFRVSRIMSGNVGSDEKMDGYWEVVNIRILADGAPEGSDNADAVDEAVWRTTRNGKHFQIDTETGQVLRGVIGQQRVPPQDFTELKHADTMPDISFYNFLRSKFGGETKAAREYFRQRLQGKYLLLKTPDGAVPVCFTGATWSELKKDINKYPLKAQLIPYLPQILQEGRLVPGDAVHEHKDIVGFHSFKKRIGIRVRDKDGKTRIKIRSVVVDVAFRPDMAASFIGYSSAVQGTKPYEKRFPAENLNPNVDKKMDSILAPSTPGRSGAWAKDAVVDDFLNGSHNEVPAPPAPGGNERPAPLAPYTPGRSGAWAKDTGVDNNLAGPVGTVNTVAADASPARFLQRTLARLFRYWTNRWDDEAQKIAESFVNSASRKTRASYLQAFRDSGFTVKADPSRILNNTVQALIGENVALIKTIPQQLFGDLTQMVQRSIAEGRDVPALEAEIMDRCGKTKKRAAVIARDQTNKAAEAVKRAENQRLGITEGIWVHVPGRKYARKSHMEFNGKKFKLDEGLYDRNEGKKVRPGECINCCCTYRPIVPGFGE